MSETYTTTHEGDFLRKLGTGKFSNISTPRLELLKKYRETMLSRLRWGQISTKKTLAHVNKLIAAES